MHIYWRRSESMDLKISIVIILAIYISTKLITSGLQFNPADKLYKI